MATGDRLTIRNAPTPAYLLNLWIHSQANGIIQITSPNLHDNVRGIRLGHVASQVKPLLPLGFKQKLIPQDTLVVKQTGSATSGDIDQGSLLIYYPNLPGIKATLTSPEIVKARMVNLLTVENTISTGTSGGYSGEEAINAEEDLLKANTYYALLGYLVDNRCATVGWRSPETGNLRIGAPGEPNMRSLTSRWFVYLSQMYKLPLIPVFNSANKANILIDVAQNEDGADVTVTSILAELMPTPKKV